MELVKIYKDEDFANAVIPEGAVLTYTAVEDGKVVTKFRDEKGEVGVIAGGNTEPAEPQIEYKGGYFVNNEDGTLTFMEVNEDITTAEGVVTDVNIVDTGVDEPLYGTAKADVVLGQVDADGNFQPLTFNGTEASDSENPEAVENYYGWNGVLHVPDNGIKVGEVTEYYKCASVDTVNKTWTGHKAVLTDGVYSFEESVVNLTYTTAHIPKIGGIYDKTCLIYINNLWSGLPVDGLVFYASLAKTANTALNPNQPLETQGNVQYSIVDGVPCAVFDGEAAAIYCDGDVGKGMSTYTACGWAKGESQPHAWLSYGSHNPRANCELIFKPTGRLHQYTRDSSPTEVDFSQSNDGLWHFYAYVCSGDSQELYLDGELVNSVSGRSCGTLESNVVVGTNRESNGALGRDGYFSGCVAAVRLYNRVLDKNEISALYSEFTPIA